MSKKAKVTLNIKFNKKYLLLPIFLIIFIQIALYLNNKQRTSFRYFKWTFQEVSIGKLISISFFSGFFISTLLNATNTSYKKNNLQYIKENNEPFNNEDEKKSNFEMPPERDIRDTQPTISVNYRVVKNTEDNNFISDENFSNKPDFNNDWENNENDW